MTMRLFLILVAGALVLSFCGAICEGFGAGAYYDLRSCLGKR